jgi:hypothetical protein
VCPKKVNFFEERFETFQVSLVSSASFAMHIQVNCNLLIEVLMLELHLSFEVNSYMKENKVVNGLLILVDEK